MAQIKFYVGLLLALALGVGMAVFGQNYMHLRQAAAQNESRGQVLENTSAGIKDGVDIDAQKQAYAKGLADARAAFKQQNQEAQRNEPETAQRAVRAVPDSVRNAARQRRLARERLGCAGSECKQRR